VDRFDYSQRKTAQAWCVGMKREMTGFEKQVYDYIKERGELLISNMPVRMMGAIPNLKNMGLVEVYKEFTNRWASKKRKFVKIRGA